jgi:hypothetical protein
MSKYSELDDKTRKRYCDYINTRWEQLYELQKEWGDKAIKMLFVTNAGGAIAILSYMASSNSAITGTVIFTLCCFFIGIILVGILIARAVHCMANLYKGWEKDANKFYSDEMSWDELNKLDHERVPSELPDFILGYASFATFIIGSIVGAIGFLKDC